MKRTDKYGKMEVGVLDPRQLKEKCEEWLRSGQPGRVARALARINSQKLERPLRLDFAQLARRSGAFAAGLRFLAPIVRPSARGGSVDPTPAEIAEYGALLQKIGSPSEALKTLESLSEAMAPEALLYRSFCHFSRWEYSKAVPLLERYVMNPVLSEYQKVIGRVNLASSYVVLRRWDQAESTLNELIRETREKGYHRLEANSHELLAQVFIQNSSWDRGSAELDEAERILKGEGTWDVLFVEKWRSILVALRSGETGPLQGFRGQALEKRHWESVRESDLYLLKAGGDERLFRRLYMGTPYAEYRERIRAVTEGKFEVPGEILLGTEGPVLELSDGTLNGEMVLRPGQKVHQMLLTLFSDSYRPWRMASLFSEVFFDQHFDVQSSPDRLHQILRRAREILESRGLPVRITEDHGNYHYLLEPGVRVLLSSREKPRAIEEHHLTRVFEILGDGEFAAREARRVLGLPLTTFHRVLEYGLSRGFLEKIGSGPRTRYRSARKSRRSA